MRTQFAARFIVALYVLAGALGVALAQTAVKVVNPVQPTKQVGTTTVVSRESLDVNLAQPVPLCGTPRQTVTVVGLVAVPVPASPLANRWWIDVCSSIENVGSPVVKCRFDGVDPVIGAGSPGDALAKGDCVRYVPPLGTSVKCVADTGGTAVTALECTRL